jgi:RHS repeat-associated protein
MKQSGQYYWYHNDHLGTPQKLTTTSGALVWSAKYTSFLEATADASSTITNNLRAPGQYFDAESGLHYNRHRFYDPKAGRYLKVDPTFYLSNDLKGIPFLLTEEYYQELNGYCYSQNNPVILFDALGLYSVDSSCDGTRKEQIDIAMVKVTNAINSECIKNAELKASLIESIKEIKIVCVKKLEDFWSDKEVCGRNWPGSNKVKLHYTKAFKSSCGSVESTILHEMVHNYGRYSEKSPMACEKSCFGQYKKYKNVKACDCK